jgi:hypothetical protein
MPEMTDGHIQSRRDRSGRIAAGRGRHIVDKVISDPASSCLQSSERSPGLDHLFEKLVKGRRKGRISTHDDIVS